jgi:glutamate-1-semialdehyde 2,1-aminomutase
MEADRSWEAITATGRTVAAGWQELAARHGLQITTQGLPALTSFAFAGPRALVYKTLVSQEMLAQGWLAATSLYASTAHTPDIVARYFEALDPVFALVAACEDGTHDPETLLDGPVCHAGFSRLN